MTVRTRGSSGEALERLVQCPAQDTGTDRWWAMLAHHLDELGQELALTDVAGLAAQVTTDAPHFAATARRLPLIHEEAQRDIARLRRAATDQLASTTPASAVRTDVEALLRRVRILHRMSSDLMLDAYERDIGGG